MSSDPSWTSEELAHALCDKLVKKGQLKEKPAFIRTDREAKIADVFKGISLDGAKMDTFENPGPLEMLLRKGTNGEVWVQHVIEGLVTMLPEGVASAAKKMDMDEESKEELAAAKDKSEQRKQRLQEREEDGGGKGKGGGKDRDGDRDRRGGGFGDKEDRPRGGGYNDREERGGRGGGGFGDREERGGRGGGFGDREERGGWGDSAPKRDFGGMTCYNCGESGHSSRDCPEPRKEKGGGKGKRSRNPEDVQCLNCKQFGHKSRDCPEPPDPEAVRERLEAKAKKDAERRG